VSLTREGSGWRRRGSSAGSLVITSSGQPTELPPAEPVRAAAGTQIKHHAIAARVERARADKRGEALGELAQQRADDMARTMRRAYAVFDYADDEGVLVYLAEGRTT